MISFQPGSGTTALSLHSYKPQQYRFRIFLFWTWGFTLKLLPVTVQAHCAGLVVLHSILDKIEY